LCNLKRRRSWRFLNPIQNKTQNRTERKEDENPIRKQIDQKTSSPNSFWQTKPAAAAQEEQ
jgi:hypothetical protein